jgi:hypothetical protein
VRHRWQLDGVVTLAEATDALRAVADELEAAHGAGWWLVEPVRNGHLLAERASRRRRPPQPVAAPAAEQAPRLPGWRVRLVDEPARPGDAVLDAAAATRTPVVRSDGARLRQVGGPALADALLAELQRQHPHQDARGWAVAPARVGPAHDLVADGSALRVHAVEEGRLVRTLEAVSFVHAADRATTLLAAAAAYRRLADATDRMAAVGGRLDGVDDGLLHVAYGRR